MIKVLVVDDDLDILELMRFNLSKNGYHVTCAENGNKAIALAKELKPKLILLDVMMPEKDGVEVCATLRDDPAFNDTLIVFLTARNEDYTQIACYENGADDYIIKPIRPRVLISRINGVLGRNRKKVSDGSILIKDISINKDQYAVDRQGEKIELAKKEFELLLLLASSPGKLFRREEIYNQVWGVDQMVGDRTIDVHIRKLRKKLGENYILTVKGIGYKISA